MRPLTNYPAIRMLALAATALLGLALAGWPTLASTRHDRDFVFTDDRGHLVLRFVGLGPEGLNKAQRDEFIDQEFSTMVHDRLRADLRFEAEPADPEWAASMEPRIEKLMSDVGPEFSPPIVECRAISCRVVLEHETRWTVQEHLAVLGKVQRILQPFVDANPESFEPVFMMTAYDKAPFMPHIKAFLPRVVHEE